jgi:hypothetical protein
MPHQRSPNKCVQHSPTCTNSDPRRCSTVSSSNMLACMPITREWRVPTRKSGRFRAAFEWAVGVKRQRGHRLGAQRKGCDMLTETKKVTETLNSPCNTRQHSTAQHSTAQHSTAQHSTAQHSTAQHGTAQHTAPKHKHGNWHSMGELRQRHSHLQRCHRLLRMRCWKQGQQPYPQTMQSA